MTTDLCQQLAASQVREQQLRWALEKSRAVFDSYVKIHRDKTPPDGEKAARNAFHRGVCEEALAQPTDTSALQDIIQRAVKESNDRLHEERELWDRMFGDGADKLAHLERELDDCLYVLEALWDKKQDKSVTQKWAEILIRNKRATGASSAEDTCHPTTE